MEGLGPFANASLHSYLPYLKALLGDPGVQTSVCKRAKPFRVAAPQRSKGYFALLITHR